MLKTFATFLIVLFVSISAAAQGDYKVIKENKDSKHQLGINKFSFVHQLCPDSFFMTELYHDLDYDSMAVIINDVYNGVTDKDNVQVTYPKVKPAAAKVTYSVQDSPKLGRIFIMLTNFNTATRKFDDNPNPKDQLARWYHIKGDRLVYRRFVYTEEKEKEKLAAEDTSNIIEYYLFDDNSENDTQVKPLLDKILAAEENDRDKYYAQIYLTQYYLMNNQIKEAGIAVNNLEEYFNSNFDIPRNQKI